MSVGSAFHLVEHGDVGIELVTNLHAELTLATNRLAQTVELLVLLLEDLRMILVQLLVVHLAGLVAVPHAVIWVVAVLTEELLRRRGGGVAEPDRLARLAAGGAGAKRLGGGGVGEFIGEGGVVGAGEGRVGGGVGEAVELRG